MFCEELLVQFWCASMAPAGLLLLPETRVVVVLRGWPMSEASHCRPRVELGFEVSGVFVVIRHSHAWCGSKGVSE
jgi:hypothetical protein